MDACILITLEEGAVTVPRLQVGRETFGHGARQLGMRVQSGGETEALPDTIWRESFHISCLVCGRTQLGGASGHVHAWVQGHLSLPLVKAPTGSRTNERL